MFAEAAGVAVTSMSNVDMKQDLLSHRDSFESDEELLVGDEKLTTPEIMSPTAPEASLDELLKALSLDKTKEWHHLMLIGPKWAPPQPLPLTPLTGIRARCLYYSRHHSSCGPGRRAMGFICWTGIGR